MIESVGDWEVDIDIIRLWTYVKDWYDWILDHFLDYREEEDSDYYVTLDLDWLLHTLDVRLFFWR